MDHAVVVSLTGPGLRVTTHVLGERLMLPVNA